MKNSYLGTIIILFFLTASFNHIKAQSVKAYAGEDDHIDVIDVDNMKVIKSIPGGKAYRMVLSHDGQKLYTTDHSNEVQIIDAEADTLIKSFDPSFGSFYTSELEGIAISPDDSRVYAVDESSDHIFVIDTATDSVINGAALDLDEAEDIIVSPDGMYLYINDNSDVTKIRTDSLTIVARTHVGNDGHGISLSNDGRKVYAEGQHNGIWGVVVLNADSLTIDTAMTASGYHLETSHDGDFVFGVDESRTLSIIDAIADTILREIEFSNYFGIRGISETPEGKYILLASRNGLIKVDPITFDKIDTTGNGYRTVVSKTVTPLAVSDNTPLKSPANFHLYPNYPNPFNPQTTIRFNISAATNVTLRIFNINGQLLQTLLHERMNAGEHSIIFDANHLASGVYYYQFQTSRTTETRKMILLR